MDQALKTILIADDDEYIVEVTALILEMAGYNVIYTLDGKLVSKVLQESKADLVLLDIWMADVDGREVCKEIKTSQVTKNIPVLIFSASHEIKQSALDAGADDFLAKPFTMPTLIHKISSLIA